MPFPYGRNDDFDCWKIRKRQYDGIVGKFSIKTDVLVKLSPFFTHYPQIVSKRCIWGWNESPIDFYSENLCVGIIKSLAETLH